MFDLYQDIAKELGIELPKSKNFLQVHTIILDAVKELKMAKELKESELQIMTKSNDELIKQKKVEPKLPFEKPVKPE